MGNRSGNATTSTSLVTYAGAILAAGLAGFAAVYATLAPPDNAGRDVPAASIATAPAAEGQVAGGGKGILTAFVVKKPPGQLPDVSFMGAGGAPATLRGLLGKPLVLNIWATWCAPCREEMPSLDRLQQQLGTDKLKVVALAVDRAGFDGAAKFLADIKVEHLTLFADPTMRAGSALRAVGMPTTILIDAEGREVGRLAGPAQWDSDDAKKLVASLLP